MTRRRWTVALVVLSACKLTEVTVDSGQQTVVVQSVLSRSHTDQFVIVEYSFNGDTVGRLGAGVTIPSGRPQIPVSGAMVTLSYDPPGPCAGRVDTLRERVPTGIPTGTYAATGLCPLTPGQRVYLSVTTPKGEVVTGQTVIPGITSRNVSSGGRVARFPLDTLPVYRERDTLRIQYGAVSGRAIEIEVRRAELHSDLSMYLFSDSLGVAMPGVLTNPFKRDGIPAFRPGRYQVLTAALADSNYFDFIRSVSDPVTARGFLNHLDGGIGVFGSVDVEQYILRVGGDRHDAREGTYRFTGRIGTVNLDFTVDAYLTAIPEVTEDEFSGIVSGTVQDGPVAISGDGVFGIVPSTGGGLNPDGFQFVFQVVRQVPPRFRQYNLRGVRGGVGGTFPADLAITNQNGAILTRTVLTGQQLTGPNLPK